MCPLTKQECSKECEWFTSFLNEPGAREISGCVMHKIGVYLEVICKKLPSSNELGKHYANVEFQTKELASMTSSLQSLETFMTMRLAGDIASMISRHF